MLDHVFRRPSLWESGSRSTSLTSSRGHPPHLIQEYVRSVEHFGCWLASEHLAIEELTRVTIRSFLTDHLPDCRCPGPAPTTLRFVRAALNHLMRLPGGPMQRPRPAAPPSPVDVVLDIPS
jgi:integrase/recombinase XerD